MGKGLNKMLEIIGVSKEDDEDFDNTFEDDEEEDIEEEGITVTQNRYPRSGGSSGQSGSSRYARRESKREDISMNTHDYAQTDDIIEARRTFPVIFHTGRRKFAYYAYSFARYIYRISGACAAA